MEHTPERLLGLGFCVSLPTITLIAIFVGTLTKKHASIAAAIAVLPISVIVSGLALTKLDK